VWGFLHSSQSLLGRNDSVCVISSLSRDLALKRGEKIIIEDWTEKQKAPRWSRAPYLLHVVLGMSLTSKEISFSQKRLLLARRAGRELCRW